MLTPFDWQEGIGNRAQYIESKLAQGIPALAVSLNQGILVLTYRRQTRKIYEIYDRLIFTAIGQQSDIESLRMGAVDFTHQEGYNRSEEDVTIQRVVSALSEAVKRSFSDFNSAPVVARSLFAEVGVSPDQDSYFTLDFDGDFRSSRRFAVIAGSEETNIRLSEALEEFKDGTSPEKSLEALNKLWHASLSEDTLLEGLTPEAILLSRSDEREDRFRVLERSDA